MGALVTRTWERQVLWASLALGFVARLFVTFTDDGIFWPDEVYQSFEPAHRLVFGYGSVAWEFIEGARHWTLPGLVALILKVCSVLGLDAPGQYVRAVKLVFAVGSASVGLAVFRLAVVSGAGERLAVAAAAAWSLTAPVLYFAPRAMSENAAAVAAAWGLALVLDLRVSRRALVLGASLLGLAVLFRLQLALFAAGVTVLLLARKDWHRAGLVLGVLCVWAGLFGALDAFAWHDAPGAKWGGWFHSAVVYWRFNVTENRGAQWGTAPFGFYVEVLFKSMPLVFVASALGLLAAARKATGLVLLTVAFFLVHSQVPHKEYRFLVPMLPELFAAAAVGFSALPERFGKWGATGLALGTALSFLTAPSLTWGQLGAYPERKLESAWDDKGSINRLMFKAHGEASLCGLFVQEHPAWHGGFTHLHRRVGLHWNQPPESKLYNFAIVRAGSGVPPVAKDGAYELVKVPGVERCPTLEEQNYSWRLP